MHLDVNCKKCHPESEYGEKCVMAKSEDDFSVFTYDDMYCDKCKTAIEDYLRNLFYQ